MASSPKINHDARYQKLLKEMASSEAEARKRESELLAAAGNLKQAVLNSGSAGGPTTASERALDAAYAKVQRLQEQRSLKTQVLLKAANDAYTAYDASKVGVTLSNQESVAKLAASHSQYAKFMATVSKAMQKQLAAAAKIHAAIEAQIKGIGGYVMQQMVAAFNSTQAPGVATKAAGKLAGSANDSEFMDSGHSNAVALSAKAPKGKAGSGYDRIKEDTYTRRAVGALERLANRPKGSKEDGSSLFSLPSLTKLLGGLAAAGLGAWLKDMWVPLKAFAFATTDISKLTTMFKEGGFLQKAGGIAKNIGTYLVETLEADKLWLKITEKFKPGLLEMEGRLMSKLAPVTEVLGKLTAGIGEALHLPQLSSLGSSLIAKAGAAVDVVKGLSASTVAVLSEAGGEFRKGAGVVGDVVAYGGRVVGKVASDVGSKVYEAGQYVASIAGDKLKGAAATAGVFLSKWANRLGNAGMVIQSALGVYEEATGHHVDLKGADWKTLVKEAVFDQSTFGRRIGGSFNKWFEETHNGQSLGSMLYDYLEGDEAAAKVAAMPIGKRQGTATPVRAAPAPAHKPTPTGSSSPSRAGSKSRSTAAGFAAPLTPSAIPDTVGSDVRSEVQNGYALMGS